jgi:alpha-L-fucosidase
MLLINVIKKVFFLIILVFLSACSCNNKQLPDISPAKVIPSGAQVKYQQLEMVGFLHFGMNTFTDKEWGNGDEDPALFNPSQLDAEQWVKVAQDCGIKELILTVKHHDGFCLWPSKFTEHSVKNSPYKNGKGDVLKEFTDACHKYGMKVGFYLSPWDRNHKDYGKPKYIEYYRNQLKEILTNYGKINEIWFDGANGGKGYYGGANEERYIDKKTYYDWPETFKLVKQLQPNILIFSDAGPDLRWVGNENGFAGETFWSTISDKDLVIGASDTKYLNTGEPGGNKWIIGQCDVSVRPGWFYHENEDSLVKTPAELLDIYYKSVGRNAVLLLNIPPDKRGLINENDMKNLKEFRQIIDESYKTNLAAGKKVSASNFRLKNPYFSPDNITDQNNETYWATDDGVISPELEIDLNEKTVFDRIVIQEPIKYGQRISSFSIWALLEGQWKKISQGTTIGYKRILKIDPVCTNKIKLKIEEATNVPAISSLGLFLSSPKENKQLKR